MAVVYSEGFDAYGATADLTNNWDYIALGASITWNSTAGRNGGGAVVLSAGAAANQIQLSDSFSIATAIPMGLFFWLKCTAAPSSKTNFLATYATANSCLAQLAMNTNGTIGLNSGDGTARFNGVTNICDGQWHWIEEYNVAQNNGTYKCWVDGIAQWGTGSSYSTPGTRTSIAIGRLPGSSTLTLDDIWVCDNTSPTPVGSDMPIGQRTITTHHPNGDSAVQFTRSAGSDNYALVDDVAADGDTTYVESGTSAHADEYDFTNLGFSPVTISGVQTVARMKNPGSGVISAKLRTHSGSTTSDGTLTPLSSLYKNYRRCHTQNPDGSVAWTQATIDAVKFGLTVV